MSTTQLLMLVLAVAGLTMVLLSTRRRLRESRALSPPAARDRYDTLKAQQGARRDLEQVMLELDQLSRQIHGRIDTKIARLESLLHEADERIRRLNETVHDASLSSIPTNAPSRAPVTAKRVAPAPTNDDARNTVRQLAEKGHSIVDIAREIGRTPGEVELMIALADTLPQQQP